MHLISASSFRRVLMLLSTAVMLRSDIASSQVTAVGPEFQVNQYTTGTQFAHPQTSVTKILNGAFVIGWSSEGQDGSGSGVFARIYDAEGVAQGTEFQVNTYTTGNQGSVVPHPRSPALSGSDQGFVIAWDGQGAGGTNGIWGKVYDPSGVALTGDLLFGAGGERPTVGMAADGSFVGVWHGSAGGDSSAAVVRRFDAAGAPLGTEFRANTTTAGTQNAPRVGVTPAGDFVVAWQAPSGSGWGTFAQRFDSTGTSVGTEFKVNSFISGSLTYPTLAADSQGFVVTWQSFGQDGSSWALVAKMYDSAGNPLGSEFVANTYTTGAQAAAAVALDDDGFVLVWDDTEQDGSGHAIYARRYNRSGVPITSEFRANTTTFGVQRDPSVASDNEGRFVIVYPSFTYSIPRDTFAQRFVVGPTTTTTTLPPVCGNSVIEMGEQCDDGNTADGDGCSATCQCEAASDADEDGIPDQCDECPNDADNDADADGLCADVDLCPADPANDADGDGHCADVDNCPDVANSAQANADLDGNGDACDLCPGQDDAIDPDGDAVPSGCDACTNVAGAQDIDIKALMNIRFFGKQTGNEHMRFHGELILPAGSSFSSIDPLTVPVRVRMQTFYGNEIFDVTLPTTTFNGAGTAGWLLNGPQTRWRFRDKTGSPANGIVSVRLEDRSSRSPGQVRVRIHGVDGTYSVQFDPDPIEIVAVLGDPAAGECGETSYSHADCVFLKGHLSLECYSD